MNNVSEQNKSWIEATYKKLNNKLSRTAVRSRNIIPYTTINGVYVNGIHDFQKTSGWWTNGFWGGLMWLMYKETGNEEFRKTAERSERFLDEALIDYKRGCLNK